MIMKFQNILFFILLFSCATTWQVRGQKMEIEERISEKYFPKPALAFIERNYPEVNKRKLYRETSAADSITYEAKFRSEGFLYSIEFWPDGQLLDIEKRVKFRSVPESTRRKMRDRWAADMKKFRVVKCQEQTSDAGTRYEVEVRGKIEQQVSFFQYLFEADGTFVQKSKIILRPNDMTLY